MKITVSSIPLKDKSTYSPTMDGYSNHIVVESIEDLKKLESIVKKDIHSFKKYKNDSRTGLFMGYDEKGKEIRGPVEIETMAGIVFDIDKETTIAQFESLDIAKHFVYVIYASKSHQIAKKNEPACDRFHVFFPFENDSSNDEQIKRGCDALVEKYKTQKITMDTSVTKNKAALIFPSRQQGETVNEHFFFRVVSEGRVLLTEEYLDSCIVESFKNTVSTELSIYNNQSAADEEYIKAVEYLRTKSYDNRDQWLSAMTSLKLHFGIDKGLELAKLLSDNANYPKESENEFNSRFNGLTNTGLEKAIFAVANAIAVRDNDDVRFLTKKTIVKKEAKEQCDFDTDIEYTGDNYVEFLNSFLALGNGGVWVKYGFKKTWVIKKASDIRMELKPYKVTMKSIDEKGKEKTVTFDAFEKWLEHSARRLIHRVVLSSDLTYHKNQINLFTGYAVDPVQCTLEDISPYLDFILNVIANGNKEIANYVIDFAANIVQLKRNEQSLILKGEQGTGKSTYTDILVKILGTDLSTKISNKDHLIGKFNDHLANKVLVYMEEAMFNHKKDKENSTDDILKTLITDDIMKIEVKFGGTFDIENRLNLVLTSNHDFPVRVERGNRRYAIVEVSESKMQDHDYFDSLYQWLENGGYEKVLYFLLNKKVGKNLVIPETEAKTLALLNSMKGEEQFVYELLNNNGKMYFANYDSLDTIEIDLTSRVYTDLLFNKYLLFCKINGIESSKAISFGMTVCKLMGVSSKVDSSSRRYYEIDITKAKRAFNAKMRTEIFKFDASQPQPVAQAQEPLSYNVQKALSFDAQQIEEKKQNLELKLEVSQHSPVVAVASKPQNDTQLNENKKDVQTQAVIKEQGSKTVEVLKNELRNVKDNDRLMCKTGGASIPDFDADREAIVKVTNKFEGVKYMVVSVDESENRTGYTFKAAFTKLEVI